MLNTRKTQSKNKKILSILFLLVLFSVNCADDRHGLNTSGYPLVPEENYSPTTSYLNETNSTTVTKATINLEEVELTSGLIPFAACDELLRYLQDEALKRVGPYGLDGFGWGPIFPMPMMERSFADTEPLMASGLGNDFSGTNVQEVGIDEPDFIKTNGEIIAILEDNSLHIVDPKSFSSEPIGSVQLEALSWGSEMFLNGNRLWVMAQTDLYSVSPLMAEIIPIDGWKPRTTIVEVDITDPSQPLQVASMVIEGRYVSARVVDGIARIVVSSTPTDLPFVTPQSPSAEEVATKANRQAIVETTISNWVPSYVFETKGKDVEEGQLIQCEKVSHPPKFSGFTSLSVLDIDLNSDMEPPEAVAVLTEGENVYASPENLFISTTDYPEAISFDQENLQRSEEPQYLTSIHQFSLGASEKTEYRSSIDLEGHLLNQFAMSEHEGHLRVATTSGSPWGFDEMNESKVTVIALREEGMTQVGQVGGMGKGERIFAVRFLEDLGYIVTFRQTDPFYTLDLAIPEDPKVKGELKITGYSGYLHPIEQNLVMGVGQEATEDGVTTGTKVALYDVENLDNPRALDTWLPGGGRSSAEWDHRAFLWWAPEQIAVLPFSDWMNGDAGAVMLKVREKRLEEFGRITHSSPDSPLGEPPEFPISIQRALIIGEEIWTYSRGQLQANLINDLSVSKRIKFATFLEDGPIVLPEPFPMP